MPETTLEARFNYHAPPNYQVAAAHDDVRSACLDAAARINALPECREKSLALTKLEEAMFWGNAAIARNHDKFPD